MHPVSGLGCIYIKNSWNSFYLKTGQGYFMIKLFLHLKLSWITLDQRKMLSITLEKEVVFTASFLYLFIILRTDS